jgi:hypothetical protein
MRNVVEIEARNCQRYLRHVYRDRERHHNLRRDAMNHLARRGELRELDQ